MIPKFSGTFDQLKIRLGSLPGQWEESGDSKKVFRHGHALLNWFPSTGTLQVQGKEPDKTQLENDLQRILSIAPTNTPDFPAEVASIHGPQTAVLQATAAMNQESENLGSPKASDADSNRMDSSAESVTDIEPPELIFGLVSAVGTQSDHVIRPLRNILKGYGYDVTDIRVSDLLGTFDAGSEYHRIRTLMERGDKFREHTKNDAVLALGVTYSIANSRNDSGKHAYIVNSLKRPEEVDLLRHIYGDGFYLIGVHCDFARRQSYLVDEKHMDEAQATELIQIDEEENDKHGQRTRDTFHMADFFMHLGASTDHVRNSMQRFLQLIFSHPYKNPTFDEFAMFMAFSSSIRSGDLSRQVGAVLAKQDQIISSGANECPRFGGGLYWAATDRETGEVKDVADGKDYKREEDSNKAEQNRIITDILKAISNDKVCDEAGMIKIEAVLRTSRIPDLTEFGRVVHAEMEALISCARVGSTTIGADLYCTTFPCHNCAKHIIAAGVRRVHYVEPYPKSKALEFHSESICLHTDLEKEPPDGRVCFIPFTGIGPRRFLDLFSVNLSSGPKLQRKDKDSGGILPWEMQTARLRVPLSRESYLERERNAASTYHSTFAPMLTANE